MSETSSTTPSPRKIAFLGLGAMGQRMAARLREAGHDIAVWNRTPAAADALVAAGAHRAETPAEAVATADIAISMLRDDDAARTVWLGEPHGALASLRPGTVAIECSTISPRWAREFHACGGTAGVRVLDAPVVGSRPQAEAGQLIFLVGGHPALAQEVEPVLRAMGGSVHHAGPAGAGAVVKLMVNTLFGIQVAALAELIALARTGGLRPERALEVLGATPVASPAARAAASGMLVGAFAPLFPVDLVAKDFGLALDLARPGGAAPMTRAASDVFERARAAGLGAENLTAVAKLYGPD